MAEGGAALRGMIKRLTRTTQEQHAHELRQAAEGCGATLVRDLQDRSKVSISGTIRTVTLRPRAGVPALEAELYDGSGAVVLVWLGRRRIDGIEPGRSLVAHGFYSCDAGRPLIFNPRYELRVGGGE